MTNLPGYRHDSTFANAERAKGDLDRIALALVHAPVFQPSTVRPPGAADPEFDFFRWCSWTYVHYIETGKVGVLFLDRRLDQYGVRLSSPDHRDQVRRLRTWLVHHVDASSGSDMHLVAQCSEWLRSACGTGMPRTSEHWASCVDRLAGDVVDYLAALLRVAGAIEADGQRGAIVADWLAQLRRTHSPAEFDSLIREVAADMGQHYIDAGQVRQRYEQKWRERLDAELDGYDFRRVIRPLIEHALLHDLSLGLPITGEDVMRGLDIPPGPGVREALLRAERLFHETATGHYPDRDALLAALVDTYRESSSRAPGASP